MWLDSGKLYIVLSGIGSTLLADCAASVIDDCNHYNAIL